MKLELIKILEKKLKIKQNRVNYLKIDILQNYMRSPYSKIKKFFKLRQTQFDQKLSIHFTATIKTQIKVVVENEWNAIL